MSASCKFGWKRKIGSKVSQDVSVAFETDAKDEQEDLHNEEIDWLSATKSRKVICLEDAEAKSRRLKEEGTLLAESERYWEAIKKWDEALQYTPNNASLLEMKAQVLMILCEVFPAVNTAKQAVQLSPTWWVGYQTLGRAQLNLGEVRQAIVSFSKAVHLNPSDSELWKEDLLWACSLLTRKTNSLDSVENCEGQRQSGVTVTELNPSDSPPSTQNYSCDSSVPDQTNAKLSFMQDTNETRDQTTFLETPRTFKTLPANYVLMRD